MRTEIGVSEFMKNCALVLDRVEAGDEFVITRAGRAVATLLPVAGTKNGKPRPEAAQEVRRLLGLLSEYGELSDIEGLWARRLAATNRDKRPNAARQACQLRKLVAALDSKERSPMDVLEVIGLMTERGWSGFEWRYLDNERQGRRPAAFTAGMPWNRL